MTYFPVFPLSLYIGYLHLILALMSFYFRNIQAKKNLREIVEGHHLCQRIWHAVKKQKMEKKKKRKIQNFNKYITRGIKLVVIVSQYKKAVK